VENDQRWITLCGLKLLVPDSPRFFWCKSYSDPLHNYNRDHWVCIIGGITVPFWHPMFAAVAAAEWSKTEKTEWLTAWNLIYTKMTGA